MPNPFKSLLAGCALAFVAACAPRPADLVLSGPTMGTTYTVKVAAPPRKLEASTVRVAIDDVLARIDRAMSSYRPDSEVSRFNAARSTQWIEVSADLAQVVGQALAVGESSGGAFDVTVAPLVDLWGFGPEGERATLPDDATLARARKEIGYRKLQVRADPPALRKAVPGLKLDLNGIAPGFAVDLLAQRLTSLGIGNFMIDIGGEIRARGRNSRGEPWRIAVERPADAPSVPYAIVQLDGMAVTTSGEYRHYFIRDGHRYSHTIDPRTGRPIAHDLASVVVIGPTSLSTDAWATALNVLGPRDGYSLASRREMPVLFIERREGELYSHATPQFAKYLVEKAPE